MKSYFHTSMIFFTLLLVSGLFISLFICIAFVSPGKPEVLRDKNGEIIEGSISEKVFVSIGGVKQGMFIRSKNIENPVLLFLHGGPGFPNYFLFEKFNPGLEDYYTVCYWEQRGGGLSYTPEVTVESMTLEQLTSDAIEVTNYLRKRFGKDRVFIMAWSGGTTIALPAVAKNPELFYAYIAMGQITDQCKSERMAYDFMLSQYAESKDRRSVKALRKYNGLKSESDLISFYNSSTRDKLMHESGIGTMRSMRSVLKGVFLPVWTCRAYTLKEKCNIWKSKIFFLPRTNLKTETLMTDFTEAYPKIDVPIYFISGKYDLTVNIHLSNDYYHSICAPVKRFYTFETAAHGPLFEDPERFSEILEKDILYLEKSFGR
ncbi:alpha/beta hydrolase [Proteiniphilum sp.]|uniref:alpha/beta fold hydrolase n=1 Tax=Proteiniphilum sp. TaxID=1926877 RepID=UPI002B1F8D1F|nr:alpha/beta hydrolase [Proteiniphilum sp.]MEA4918449.1 alpha/beta hydrolase [Proteiniphilum sp.]